MAEEVEIHKALSLSAGGWVLFVDQTMVPAGPTHRGRHLTLCLAVRKRRRRGKRSSLAVELILLDTRMSLTTALQTLAIMIGATPPSLIIHDGDPTITENLEHLFPGIPRQRCLWHMERGLGFALWEDKLSKASRVPFQTRLQHALQSPSDAAGRRRYRELTTELDRHGLRHAAAFLHGAENEVFTFRTPIPGLDPSLAGLIAQSPIERRMRELNRRADVGCRWNPQGLDAVLLLLVTAALEEHSRPLLETHGAA